MKESDIQNAIRIALSPYGTFFRINVGQGWIGKIKGKSKDGLLVLENPRVFKTGVPEGFSDLFGVRPVKITPAMVGRTIGQAVFLEVKSLKGRAEPEQEQFIDFMQSKGCIAVIVRSPEEAIKAVENEQNRC